MKSLSYFAIGDIISQRYPQENCFFDIFGDQNGWVNAVEKEASRNKKYAVLLKKARDSGFLLCPKIDMLWNLVSLNGNNSLTALVYKNNTVYRRIFNNQHEAIALARRTGISKWIDLSYESIDALKNAFVNALPHELGHSLWESLDNGQKKGWEDVVLHPDTDIEVRAEKRGNTGLLSKGYDEGRMNAESFCSYLNACVCPDAKNLSGAKPNALIERFFRENFGLN
jgi:hypothetical protein